MTEGGPEARGPSTASVRASGVRDDPIPLVRRFPSLAAIPRARLGRFPTPVVHLTGFRDVDQLYVKREDLSSDVLGGNKVRSLEFLLGHVTEGDTVLTIGGGIDARPGDRRARGAHGREDDGRPVAP